MGLGYLHGAAALLTVVKLPLKLSETVFLHPPTQRMTHSQGCLGNLATHFCWEATQAAAAWSETPLGACTSSSHNLPLDNCKDTNVPCQESCLKEQDLFFTSVILECSAWRGGESKISGHTAEPRTGLGPSVPALSQGDLLFLWLVFEHERVEMAAPQTKDTWWWGTTAAGRGYKCGKAPA